MAFSFNLDNDGLSLPVSVGLVPHLLTVMINGFGNTITFEQVSTNNLFIYFH